MRCKPAIKGVEFERGCSRSSKATLYIATNLFFFAAVRFRKLGFFGILFLGLMPGQDEVNR